MSTTEKIKITGVARGALPWWILNQKSDQKILVVIEQEEDVLSLVDDFRALSKLPSSWSSSTTLSAVGYTLDDEPGRQVALFEWFFKGASVLVCSQEGLSVPTDSPEQLRSKSFLLKPGVTLSRNNFEEILTRAGYSRSDRTEQVGEYSIRGDVIDIWPAGEEIPLRITWNFDTLEALRLIDMHSQRSTEYLREINLVPVLAGTETNLSALVSPDSMIFHEPGAPSEGFEPPPTFVGHMNLLRTQLQQWYEEDWQVVIFCHNEGERDRLDELLLESVDYSIGSKPPWLPTMVIGEMEHGFVHPFQRRAILTNSEIFGRYRKRVRLPKFEAGTALNSPLDINPNDFLVHEKHGIGRYLGLRTLKVSKVSSEYLALEYKGADKLYVPIFEIQQVQKYSGAEGKRPALSSLDTAAWERVKSKVQEDVAKLAAELLRKAAKRTIRSGYAFPAQTHLEKEFSSSFIYKLTSDQVKTLEEVEKDMMSSKAMDRLICGDVGYGKTEVAMRAALKAALAGKQVGFLCPTTILAEQHYRNFSDRMADYPVTVKLLSRFQEKNEQNEIIENIIKGGVDIAIGTHRLLSSDIGFKDLGLLIIDEEHRFGVKQKNKLLELRDTVDVLSLTATPIPRTLSSALGGIKDLSIIETPPEGRQPISTHVGGFDEDVMVQAVQKELDRGGQVFYVHNRVKTLLARKQYIESVLPGVRVVMAHGQVTASELEKAMYDFLHKKVDVLLATTIIESGLDIPSVNTLIVEEAEELGLAQLYQLRGRVGRSPTRAYCYLFYSHERMTTDARKRLQALKEFTALGSGFRLAMRDMEIRGAGNLLGPQQHGSMAAVGIETYSRLLNEEIAKLKGEPSPEEKTNGPLMEVALSAYIPEDYLPSEVERVQMYKRILSADAEQLAKLKEELVDRCGALPEPAKILFDTAGLRVLAKRHGVAEVHQEEDCVLIYFRETFKLSDKSFKILLAQPDEVLTLIPGRTTGVRLFIKEPETVLDALGRFMRLIFA